MSIKILSVKYITDLFYGEYCFKMEMIKIYGIFLPDAVLSFVCCIRLQ